MNALAPWLAGLALALPAPAALGQAATKSLGAPKSGVKLLTRDELRGCLRQQKTLGARRPAIEAERAGLEGERRALDELQRWLHTEREAIDKLTQAATDLQRRMHELSQQTTDFNERVRRFQASGPAGPTAQRQQRALERDKTALDKSAAALQAERTELGPRIEQASLAYNMRAAARNRSADDWNVRHARLAQGTQAFELELQSWKIDCEGRSYREDDEQAILSGQ